MPSSSIQAAIDKYRWYHIIEVEPGVFTPGNPRFVAGQNLVMDALRTVPLKGLRVLDIGCRDGLFSFAVEKMGAAEVVAIDNDLSPGAAEFLIPHLRSKVRMAQMNLMDLTPQTFGLFDVVVFPGVLYHLRYPFWGLKRVRDVLAPGGKLVIETAICHVMERWAMMHCPVGAEGPYEPTSPTFFNLKGLRDTLQSIGLTVRSTQLLSPAPPEPPPIPPIRELLRMLGQKAAMKLGRRRAARPPIAKLPTNRAVLVCDYTPECVEPVLARYWDLTHTLSSVGLKKLPDIWTDPSDETR